MFSPTPSAACFCAVRCCQRLFIARLKVLTAQRALLSLFWDAVDRDRVMAIARQKHIQLQEAYAQKRREKALADIASEKSGRVARGCVSVLQSMT